MKAHVLAIPLVFSTLTACAAPVADAAGQTSDELIRRTTFDPGGIITILPDYCTGATGTITTSSSSLTLGATTTLQWSVNVPAGCTTAVKINGEAVPAVGNKVVTPLSNSAYVLQIGNDTLAYANVAVALPSTVRIKGSTNEWKALLVQAVGTPNTRVVLDANVDMDLSGYENIVVRQGVTLTSEKPAVSSDMFLARLSPDGIRLPRDAITPPALPGRDARTLGPRLYTNT